MNVWKIASRWNDHGENNEDDKILPYFNKYKVVFAGRFTDYVKSVKKDDIIAVTDGVTVKAVAKAIETPKLLSEFGIKELEDYYVGDEPTIGIKVDLHELEKKDYFSYNRGTFHKVHGTYTDIITKLFQQKSKKHENTKVATCIKDIYIKNYNGIIETQISDISENTKWIFLTGINGFGKTSVLRSIMVALQGETVFNAKEVFPEGTAITFLSNKVENNIYKNTIENKSTEEETFYV